MPYHVRITTDTDGLINDAKPYPTLAAAMQVAGLSLKTGGATTACTRGCCRAEVAARAGN